MKKIRHIIALSATGLLITMTLLIQPLVADDYINDDFIVDGRACIGLDCVNGEGFGYEQLKLKGDYVNLKFEDTSVGTGISANDWQIRINDRFIGVSDFSIQDVDGWTTPFTILAGAPNSSLFVDEYGSIGIGTDNPYMELHITTGWAPTIRLEQDDSVGLPISAWDVGGDHEGFYIRNPNADYSFLISSDATMHNLVLAEGNVGIGTWSPDANLHLAGGNDDATFLFETTGNGWYMLNKNASGRFNITDDPTFARVPFKIGVNAQQNLMKIGCGVTDQVYINGNLVVAGTITPDYVFEDRYPLQSIEEHADFMWKEKHLPAVEKAKVDEEGKGVVNLGQRSQELLEELETAHIYIQQLNKEIKALKSLNSTMKENFDNKIKSIENRLSKIDS